MHHLTRRPGTVRRTVTALTLGLAISLAAAACGNDDGSGGTGKVSATEHNDADVAFATDMLQHHAQALSMVDLTLNRPLDPQVQELAEEIREAQAPEIETFSDWLTDWDEEIPETMRDHSNAGHDMHGDMGDSMEGLDSDMPGMMSADEMNALQDASDAEFQTMWLQMMIEHHAGAIEMAEAEQEDGQYEPAIELAADIVESQSAEIEEMEKVLGS